MNKLEKVVKFVRAKKNGRFTWRQFMAAMDCQYPSTETNYLSMLVRSQYVARVARGQYEVWILPGHGISYNQLAKEAGLNWRSSTDYAR